jgi:hypothetical protein
VPATVRVGTLRVRAGGAALGRDVTARLRAEALLAALDLPPPGLADRAVLVVRRAEWPAGRRLAATAQASLDELRRTAVRPARSPARAAGADAVLFADDAELVACLTSDALAGQLTRWYWRRLGPPGAGRVGAVLAAAWTERVRWLPAALACLPAGAAARAVSTLTAAEAASVRRALVAEFAGWPGAPGGARSPLRGQPPGAVPAGPGQPGTAPPGGAPGAPWRDWLAVSWPLSPEQEALLGVAAALYAQPARARRLAFLADVDAWLSGPARTPATRGARPPGRTGPGPAGLAASPTARPTRPASPAGSGHSADSASDAARPAREGAGSGPDRAPVTGIAAAAPLAPVWTDPVPSRIASALYLVNLLGWLDLPGAWPAGTAPGGWAIVELLARHLLGAVAPPDDPLWALLAELDGHEPGVAAGPGARPADPVRLPPGWLRRWAAGPARWEWAERRGRLVISDADRGFVIADLPCAADRGELAAATELTRLHAAGAEGSLHQAGPAAPDPPSAGEPGLARWRGAVGQFAAWLLADRGVRTSALARPGRISVTRTHVDVVLDLEDIDMAARVSGLDRDPGWVPDLGRVVCFHFEAVS